jgi:hypothetical protein
MLKYVFGLSMLKYFFGLTSTPNRSYCPNNVNKVLMSLVAMGK